MSIKEIYVFEIGTKCPECPKTALFCVYMAISSGLRVISKPIPTSAKVQIFSGMRKVSEVCGLGRGVVGGGWEVLMSYERV